MDGLLTADNLPTILAIVLSATVLNWLRDVWAAFWTWRKGASEKERNVLLDVLAQLERCHQDRDHAANDRDAYRRQVGRRDFLLLKNGIDPPADETGILDDDHSSVGAAEPAT